MITFENIKKVNETVKSMEIKGKNYVAVAARISAFRELCPMGSIETNIVSLTQDSSGVNVVTMRSQVSDENGKILGTGFAQEKENSSFINKTSFIENCETSAVGRALGMLGIGSDEQMASAEEMVNVLTNQNNFQKSTQKKDTVTPPNKDDIDLNAKISAKQVLTLKMMCKKHEMPEEKIYEKYNRGSIEELTLSDWIDFGKTGQDILAAWDKREIE